MRTAKAAKCVVALVVGAYCSHRICCIMVAIMTLVEYVMEGQTMNYSLQSFVDFTLSLYSMMDLFAVPEC